MTVSSLPPLKRASYILHIVSVAGLGRNAGNQNFDGVNSGFHLDLIRLLDEVLDLFDSEPRFQHFVLDGQAILLEDYLTARPEAFERIETAVHDGRLLVGPWYAQTDPARVGTESLIRNLMIGLRTARVFGRPMLVGYLPWCSSPPSQLPQILKGFGIDCAILACSPRDQPMESIYVGGDGTRIVNANLRDAVLGQDQSIPEQRAAHAPYSESGHLMLPYVWEMSRTRQERLSWLYSLPAAQRQLHDSVFHSTPSAYAKAIELYGSAHAYPDLPSSPLPPTPPQFERIENLLARRVDPLLAWAESLPTMEEPRRITRPQLLLQKLWRALLDLQQPHFLQADLDGALPEAIQQRLHAIEANADQLVAGAREDICQCLADSVQIAQDGWPALDQMIRVSVTEFKISTIKLPEEADRQGMIVRGWNFSDQDVWVTLTPWREFAVVEVVSLDEVPTGGKLATENAGAVRFRAEPKRILTFWFHD